MLLLLLSACDSVGQGGVCAHRRDYAAGIHIEHLYSFYADA